MIFFELQGVLRDVKKTLANKQVAVEVYTCNKFDLII